ncbi:hypothetical protein DFJ58DRAFT_914498 [Suillus subalutaceus]|uniref:uncharacterized protein n=1 Tax=Suillus subalutaceus TaxID=48586 RepID=UPI001B872F4D|nr:uncharacterized protein DFJ58DRAFT_914498 [Suillus subalutaceus]KAG1851578.1 hypothetical protein DFJ58DRAFT_914498 [Suillus subalutaceus]
MLRWCLSTVRVLGGVDGGQRIRLLSSASAHVQECLPRSAGTQDTSKRSFRTSDDLQESGPSNSTRAISALQEILTSPALVLDPSRRPTPNTIRSFYISAKARDQLSQLDSGMLSALIGLFASLSVDSTRRCVYTSSLLPYVKDGPVTRDYWAFVKEVVSLKQQRGMRLVHSDRYWMMRAELASLSPSKDGQPGYTHPSDRSLFRARKQYLHFSRHVFDPDVHVQYLTALLSSTSPLHKQWAIDAMTSILLTHPFLHAKVLKVLLGIVHDTDTEHLRSILSAISIRVTRFPSPCGDTTKAPMAVPVDATTFTSALSVFPLPVPSPSPHMKVITELLHEAFSSNIPLVHRRRNLLLCSLLYSCNSGGIPISSLDFPLDGGASVWQTLFALAILEEVTRAAGPALLHDRALRGRIQEMIHSLHESWLHLVPNESHPTLISRAVTTSLFRLSAAVADPKLFAACLESSTNFGLWTGDSSDTVEGPQLAAMAAMHLAAFMQVRGCGTELVIKTLSSYSTDVQHQCAVASAAVKDLIHRDVELARILYNITIRSGRDIDVDTTYTLARTLPPHHAVGFLMHERFSRVQVGGLLSSIARFLKETRHQHYDADLFNDVGISLRKFYAISPPPIHFRGHLQLLLAELCTRGRGFQTTAIIANVIKFQPTFFQSSFLLRLVRLFLRRKQFRCALRMQKILIDARGGCTTNLRYMVTTRRCVTASRHLSTKGRKSYTLFRGGCFWAAGTSFKSVMNSGPVYNRVLQDLIYARRPHAAKVAFSRVASKVDTKSRTILGNTLLHGVVTRPVPRNGRRVRKLLGLLNNLVSYQQFAPDRITVNIILKALIAWRTAFDYRRLRALFDHMVRGGYPAGIYSPSHPPFNTPILRTSGTLALSKLPPYISFEKHAKPMLKMFIKAFYLRNDVEAARTVVEILKIEQQKATLQREQRSVARSRGWMKAESNTSRRDDTTHVHNNRS